LFCRAAKCFGIYQQKQLKLNESCRAAKKFRNLPTRTTQLTAFRSAVLRKLLNCDQKHCSLFSHATKFFGIATKSTVFCSAAQRKVLELRTKALYSNCEQKHCIWFSRAEKILELRPKALYFIQRKVLDLRPKVPAGN
jgi:hypothetical protein